MVRWSQRHSTCRHFAVSAEQTQWMPDRREMLELLCWGPVIMTGTLARLLSRQSAPEHEAGTPKIMFLGQFEYRLDDKNRRTLPAKLREQDGEKRQWPGFYLTRGLDSCLFMYTPDHWEEVVSYTNKSFTKAKARQFQRLFFASVSYCACDKQGRICLPAKLKAYAGIDRYLMLVVVYDRLDLWNPYRWREYEARCENGCAVIVAALVSP